VLFKHGIILIGADVAVAWSGVLLTSLKFPFSSRPLDAGSISDTEDLVVLYISQNNDGCRDNHHLIQHDEWLIVKLDYVWEYTIRSLSEQLKPLQRT
jgi:hypothetical protein